jgi:hypothetical protein
MSFFSFNISDIISSLCKIGASLSEQQLIALKWRLSENGQKNYTREETNKFYTALRSGDTTVLDLMKKERQNLINDLKNEIDFYNTGV